MEPYLLTCRLPDSHHDKVPALVSLVEEDCEEDAEQDMSLDVVEEGGGVLVTLMGETVEARVSL